MRVSERMKFDATQNRVNEARYFALDTQDQAASGRKLRQVSDDPSGTVRVFRNRTRLENIAQFRRTNDYIEGFLGKTEDSLRSITESIMRAKELAVQQSNGVWDPGSRKTVSFEVQQLAQQIVQLGNSTYGDRYIFGGFQTSSPPVAGDGHYAGDDGLIYVQLDEDTFRPINIPGRKIFEVSVKDNGQDVPLLKIVQDFKDSLEFNDVQGIFRASARLDGALSQLAEMTASLGARRAAVRDAAERLDTLEEFAIKDNVSLESADPVTTALDMKRAETTLGYTMNASAKVLGPSLMDFLK
ncbi:MAG: flagellar hook-associated protein 3 [Proteobacteria bacterium]|nr:flagellar hook-associated protein 3 [Pseudomonadota bacterium]